jgi:hypothetical protein
MRTKLYQIVTLACVVAASPATAQAGDPVARLREVLPADVATRVLAKIAEARSRDLPASVLEQRALKFAARGVAASAIERSINEHAERLLQARSALEAARGRKADDGELDAGADALRKGVPAAGLSELAQAAPSGRSLAMPLYALGSLLDRGLPSDQAIRRVYDRLQARATDSEFQNMATDLPQQAAGGQANKPELTGQDRAATRRPDQTTTGRGRAGGTVVPGNAGKDTRPLPKKPATPPGRSGRSGG